MYPYLKLAITLIGARFRTRLELEDNGVQHRRVGLTDIDMFMELNHARQISYLELGRWDYAYRVGFIEVMKRNNWGITVGWISARYRRRVPLLKSFSVTTRPICHDGRWVYFLQEIWSVDRICTSALVKAGAVSRAGLVPAPEVLAALGREDWGREVPQWVSEWIAAEGQRPWPAKP